MLSRLQGHGRLVFAAGAPLAEAVERHAEDPAVGARTDRESPVAVTHPERASVLDERQVSVLEDLAVLIAEDREQHFVFQLRLRRPPIDVEELGVRRPRTVLEHVVPPDVVARIDAHVVWDDIRDKAHPPRGEARMEPRHRRVVADLPVDEPVVDHVVAVGAARSRLEERRGVDVGHAERVEVVDDARERVEAEVLRQLHAVGRHRRARRGRRRSRRGSRPAVGRSVRHGSGSFLGRLKQSPRRTAPPARPSQLARRRASLLVSRRQNRHAASFAPHPPHRPRAEPPLWRPGPRVSCRSPGQWWAVADSIEDFASLIP